MLQIMTKLIGTSVMHLRDLVKLLTHNNANKNFQLRKHFQCATKKSMQSSNRVALSRKVFAVKFICIYWTESLVSMLVANFT